MGGGSSMGHLRKRILSWRDLWPNSSWLNFLIVFIVVTESEGLLPRAIGTSEMDKGHPCPHRVLFKWWGWGVELQTFRTGCKSFKPWVKWLHTGVINQSVPARAQPGCPLPEETEAGALGSAFLIYVPPPWKAFPAWESASAMTGGLKMCIWRIPGVSESRSSHLWTKEKQ